MNLLPLFLGFAIVLAATTAPAADPSVFQIRLVKDQARADTEQFSLTITSRDGKSRATEVLHLEKKVLLDGGAVRSVTAARDQSTGLAQLQLKFSDAGRELLAKISGEHIGRRLAFVVGGKALTAPTIREAITGGAAVISGSFSESEAKALAKQINEAVKKP